MERRTHPPAHPLAGNLFRRGRHRAPHTHYFDDELFGRNREHTLRLTATDGAGNTRVWEGTYYR